MESTDSETSSSVDTQQQQQVGNHDTRGKHRILADMNRLDQESRFLEVYAKRVLYNPSNNLKKWKSWKSLTNVSATCQELLHYIESRSDPLLSVTSCPANPVWDRLFEGGKEMKQCRCSIL